MQSLKYIYSGKGVKLSPPEVVSGSYYTGSILAFFFQQVSHK